jgi:hypothetical protein
MARRDADVDPGERALWPDLMSLGLAFPLCIVLGFFLGRWIGGWFAHPITGQWVGLIFGIVAAFRELYKVHLRLAKQDAKDLQRFHENEKDSDG